MTPSPIQQPRTGLPTKPRGEGDFEPREGTGVIAQLLGGLMSAVGGFAALLVALVTVVGAT